MIIFSFQKIYYVISFLLYLCVRAVWHNRVATDVGIRPGFFVGSPYQFGHLVAGSAWQARSSNLLFTRMEWKRKEIGANCLCTSWLQ